MVDKDVLQKEKFELQQQLRRVQQEKQDIIAEKAGRCLLLPLICVCCVHSANLSFPNVCFVLFWVVF